jgi:enoyl-CoA hydratase/carnithine racemase
VCGPRVDDVVYGAGLYRDTDAVTIGLVNEVVAGEDLLAAAVARATALAAYNPPAFRLAKEQRQRAAVARMRADGPAADALVRDVWAAPAAKEAARAVLDGVGRR